LIYSSKTLSFIEFLISFVLSWKYHKKIQHIPFESIHKNLLKRPGYKSAYEDHEMEFEIKKAIIIARGRQGLTQRQLAKRVNIPQSSLARFESGRINPSLSFLRKVTSGLGLRLAVL